MLCPNQPTLRRPNHQTVLTGLPAHRSTLYCTCVHKEVLVPESPHARSMHAITPAERCYTTYYMVVDDYYRRMDSGGDSAKDNFATRTGP